MYLYYENFTQSLHHLGYSNVKILNSALEPESKKIPPYQQIFWFIILLGPSNLKKKNELLVNSLIIVITVLSFD